MNDYETGKKLDRITYLLAANLIIMTVCAVGLIIGLLPKLERVTVSAESVTASTERMEARVQEFVDEVQPVVSASAGMALESIMNMDTERLSQTVSDRSDELINAAAEEAMRYFNRSRATEAE